MERFTVSIDEELIAAFDAFIACKGYDNRSEAIRDLIREKLHADRLSKPDSGECVACLSYVYDHNERRLASRVVEAHHHHHDLSRATTRVQLDHHDCMEVTILEGSIESVTSFADELMAEKGVRHGALNIVPMAPTGAEHRHAPNGAPHVHRKPVT